MHCAFPPARTSWVDRAQFGDSTPDGPPRPRELGWKSLGVLELTVLPSLGEERWVHLVHETDVLLVAGGDAVFLNYWMRFSGSLRVVEREGIRRPQWRQHGDDAKNGRGIHELEAADWER